MSYGGPAGHSVWLSDQPATAARYPPGGASCLRADAKHGVGTGGQLHSSCLHVAPRPLQPCAAAPEPCGAVAAAELQAAAGARHEVQPLQLHAREVAALQVGGSGKWGGYLFVSVRKTELG